METNQLKHHTITQIVAGTTADVGHDDQAKTKDTKKEVTTAADTEQPSSLPLILSIVSVILSLVALVGAFRKR